MTDDPKPYKQGLLLLKISQKLQTKERCLQKLTLKAYESWVKEAASWPISNQMLYNRASGRLPSGSL